jgi:hypothetical protein
MRFRVAKILCALGAFSVFVFSTFGGVRVSFLQDSNSLNQTIKFLNASGCTKQGVAVFDRAVRQYNKEPLAFDLSKFSNATNGFYFFASPHELITAFPNQCPEPRHSAFNCANAVIALADSYLITTSHPDDLVGPIEVSTYPTNRELVGTASTPREAFNLASQSWARELTDPLFPESMRDMRMCLYSFLLQWYEMPVHVDEAAIDAKMLDVLRTTWKRDGIKFPEQFEVVLLYSVQPWAQGHSVRTSHAGLMLRRDGGFTYLEKIGWRGPFIRLDLDARFDLMPWLAVPLGICTNVNCHHFATFNDRTIRRISRQ